MSVAARHGFARDALPAAISGFAYAKVCPERPPPPQAPIEGGGSSAGAVWRRARGAMAVVPEQENLQL